MPEPRAAYHASQHPVDHAHVADLETCLDLVNTLELEDGVPTDHLASATEALAWFDGHGVAHLHDLHRDATAHPDAWLARVRTARAALRETWDAAVDGRSPRQDALDTLNRIVAHAPRARLQPALTGVVVGHVHDAADPTAEALARVAQPLIAALAAGDTARFRVCANDGCRWVFEDTSRGGRRRWCDMTSCGNRAKVRRFRAKRRVAGDPAQDAGSAVSGGGDAPGA